MSRASAILNELFQDSYPYDYRPPDGISKEHAYHFKTDSGDKLSVWIEHHNNAADVMFASHGSINVTGRHPRDAQKVFGTVYHILKHHLKEHPEIPTVKFLGFGKSRKKLYSHFISRFTTRPKEKRDDEKWGRYEFDRDEIR